MRSSWGVAFGSVFGGWAGAPISSSISSSATATASRYATANSTSSHHATVTATSTTPTHTSSATCGDISDYVASFVAANPSATAIPPIPALDAMSCLESVPIAVDTDLAFLEYIEPFIQFQSTQAYLKNPPTGYTVDGVDLFGGLAEITQKLKSGGYKTQYAFEKDIYILINILPKDFHFNLPLPLISNIFEFQTDFVLVSVSTDGTSLPQVFSEADLKKQFLATTALNWKPSPIVTINGENVADYLLSIGLASQQYADPDAVYNRVFISPPLLASDQGSAFTVGGNLFGFSSAYTNIVFSNGTNINITNVASIQADFTDVTDGSALFQLLELPATAAAATSFAAPTASSAATSSVAAPAVSTTTQLPGYPTPVVIHRDGYTSGYFLPNSSIAVLSLTAFTNAAETEDANPIMQAVVKAFLKACRAANKTKLIVDLQGNGGGSVLNGLDTFVQLFPTIDPFGATRFRETPLVAYFADEFSKIGIYNESFSSVYQTQANVDMNEKDFPNVQSLVGPFTIYNDNFTALVRYNLSDPVEAEQNDIIITGTGNMTNVAPQEFTPDNIVMIHDGGCGSTCAIFFELMKAQGGVRSIAMGGRPQTGPMQAVAGSKGAQVFTYGNILEQFIQLSEVNAPAPNVPSEFNISVDAYPPLGPDSDAFFEGSRFNLRNNYNSSNPAEFPLQFVYEAANCRLFYEASDIFDISGLWTRVANTVWGNGKCVSGSSPNSNNSFPSGAYNSVPFSKSVLSNISLPDTLPGFVKNNGTGPKTGGNSNGTITTTTTPTTSTVPTSGTAGLSVSVALMMGMSALLALL